MLSRQIVRLLARLASGQDQHKWPLTCGNVELRRLELRTSCMPYTLRRSLGVAGRGSAWRSPAASVAGRGLASPDAGPRWLPTWLPANSLAPLMFDNPAVPAMPSRPPSPGLGTADDCSSQSRADSARLPSCHDPRPGSNLTAASERSSTTLAGIRTVLCSVLTPRMNAIAERWIGGCRTSSWTAPWPGTRASCGGSCVITRLITISTDLTAR